MQQGYEAQDYVKRDHLNESSCCGCGPELTVHTELVCTMFLLPGSANVRQFFKCCYTHLTPESMLLTV